MEIVKKYRNYRNSVPVVEFGDVVVKRIPDNHIERMRVYYADKVKIKYTPGLIGAYGQTCSKIICTAELPEDCKGFTAVSEGSPFGKSLIGRRKGEYFCVSLPERVVETYMVVDFYKCG